MMKITKQNGFTLIEIMIVVAIIGILASISYNSFLGSALKAKRTDGKESLLKYAAKQEQWYLQHNQYTPTIADLGGSSSQDGYYLLSVTNTLGGSACDGATCYTLTATAAEAQRSDTDCMAFTIDNLGRKKAQNSSGTDTSDTCW